MPKTFRNKDEIEQQFEQRQALQQREPRRDGVYLPLDREEPRPRPSIISQVCRSMSEIRPK